MASVEITDSRARLKVLLNKAYPETADEVTDPGSNGPHTRSLEKENAALKRDLDKAKGSSSDALEKVETLQAALNESENRVIHLETVERDQQARLDYLEEMIEGLKSDLERSQSNNNKLFIEMDKAKADNRAAEHDLDGLRNENADLVNEMDALKQEKDGLIRALDQATSDNSDLLTELDTTKTENQKLEKALEDSEVRSAEILQDMEKLKKVADEKPARKVGPNNPPPRQQRNAVQKEKPKNLIHEKHGPARELDHNNPNKLGERMGADAKKKEEIPLAHGNHRLLGKNVNPPKR